MDGSQIIKLARLSNPNMSQEQLASLQSIAVLFDEGDEDELQGPVLWDSATALGIVRSKQGDPFPGTIGLYVEGAIGVNPTRLRLIASRSIDVRGARDLKRLASWLNQVADEAEAEFEKGKKLGFGSFGPVSEVNSANVVGNAAGRKSGGDERSGEQSV